jgi:hypothetical protein
VYCPECGYHQSEAHKFCGRCGALLISDGQITGETTGPFTIAEVEAEDAGWSGVAIEGPTLAVRSGGGISGELFPLEGERVTIGRSPKSHIFLDDVTVSRNHAEIRVGPGGVSLQDLGSLNGTYVNRRRIEVEEPLVDGDELQIGKFRLTYIGG